jgi:hypothetical protein
VNWQFGNVKSIFSKSFSIKDLEMESNFARGENRGNITFSQKA